VVVFGLAEYVSLGSTVWIDTNGDGAVDPEEEGIAGVLVNLYDLDGVLVDIAETDADGNYLFTDLLPGTYLVQLVPDSLPEELRATFDRDGSPDLNTIVTLLDGVSILDANFGFQTSDDLPNTGFDMQVFLLAGLLLTLVGMVLVATTGIRRRLGEAAAAGSIR
jgi:LPXTG-motif cell wall-anchored protein